MAVEGFDFSVPWSEFKKLKERPDGVDTDAESRSGFRSKSINFDRKGNALVVKDAEILIAMDSANSWVVASQMTNQLLEHEQGHYDITALAARTFYKKLFTLTAPNAAALQKSIDALNKSLQNAIKQANLRYDKQTNHSEIRAEQEKWNKALATEKLKGEGSLDNLP